nr:sodium-dependent phosphate transport protein 2B-like [Nothobranchius furzeri]
MGILLWYPIPFMWVPIRLARGLGNKTAKYRWFAALYLFLCFVILPLSVFGLSLAGWQVVVGIGVPVIALIVVVIIINVMQSRCPRYLPKVLRTWDFLPQPLHSTAPMDRVVTLSMLFCGRHCCYCCRSSTCCRKDNNEEKISRINMKGLEMYKNSVLTTDKNINTSVIATHL